MDKDKKDKDKKDKDKKGQQREQKEGEGWVSVPVQLCVLGNL